MQYDTFQGNPVKIRGCAATVIPCRGKPEHLKRLLFLRAQEKDVVLKQKILRGKPDFGDFDSWKLGGRRG
jgi:hypothetical protein